MKTFFMIKPDGVERALTNEIIAIVEDHDFNITKKKDMHIDEDMAKLHYAEHHDKPFFNDLIEFITSGPVVAMELEGEEAVSRLRELMGATNPSDAEPGTIRAKYGTELEKNVVHGSDSPESAERELNIFFG
tara:strand:+ start:525 stop:920 length:396 start_codon:yes stop_codon:yes gene_type:complete